MKKGFLFIFSLLSIGLIQAQVGINTTSPQGVFHIDGKGNTSTSGSVNVTDDFVVNVDGNVGIGTANPQTKLDVMGSVLIAGGSPAVDKVLTSNNEGVGTWKVFDRSKGLATWQITAIGVTISGTMPVKGVQTLSDPNGMGFSTFASTTSSAITVPAGTFLIIIDFDVNVVEYGTVGIYKYSTGEYLYQVFYFEQLTGGSAICTFSVPTTIELKVSYRNLSNSGITRYTVPPFNNANLASTIRFISLTK